MVAKKHKSKRVSANHRYKVDRRVKEHHRKLRKAAKQHPVSNKSKKDPGIPNSFPFKDEVLQEAVAAKARMEQERERQKEARRLHMQERRNMITSNMTMVELARFAESKQKEFDRKVIVNATEMLNEKGIKVKDNSKRAYFREFRKVVDAADVILEVLDARDPIGCRAPEIEEMVLSAGIDKKIILVLNKIDLVPRETVERWLKYFRNEFPTIAFKASTQTQRRNLGQSSRPALASSTDLQHTSECLGAETLIKLLKNYSRSGELKTTIRVGVIGYPNVGKSSLINSLKRSHVVGVGATPGFTKVAQEIKLDEHIKLLDCPGIIFATGDEADILLRNCVKVEQVEDPVGAVGHLLRRIGEKQMMAHYALPAFSSPQEMLMHLAQQKGKLKKGGMPNIEMAGRLVLQDFNSGRISYYTEPPKDNRLIKKSVVTQFGKEFTLADLEAEENATVLSAVAPASEMSDMMEMAPGSSLKIRTGDEEEEEEEEEDDEIDSDGPDMDVDEDDEDEDEDEDEMDDEEDEDEDEDEPMEVQPASKAKAKRVTTAMEDAVNPQVNRSRRQQLKKQKRDARRVGGSDDGSDNADGDDNDDYSFSTDFVPMADDDDEDDDDME